MSLGWTFDSRLERVSPAAFRLWVRMLDIVMLGKIPSQPVPYDDVQRYLGVRQRRALVRLLRELRSCGLFGEDVYASLTAEPEADLSALISVARIPAMAGATNAVSPARFSFKQQTSPDSQILLPVIGQATGIPGPPQSSDGASTSARRIDFRDPRVPETVRSLFPAHFPAVEQQWYEEKAHEVYRAFVACGRVPQVTIEGEIEDLYGWRFAASWVCIKYLPMVAYIERRHEIRAETTSAGRWRRLVKQTSSAWLRRCCQGLVKGDPRALGEIETAAGYQRAIWPDSMLLQRDTLASLHRREREESRAAGVAG